MPNQCDGPKSLSLGDFAMENRFPRLGNRGRSVTSIIIGELSIDLLDDFLAYLTEHGVSLSERTRRESFAITKQWTLAFGKRPNEFSEAVGSNAVRQWLQTEDKNLVLLFLSSRISAFPLSENSRPCSAFTYSGPAIDVSDYHELEFAVFPVSYAWTLVHTHEDFALGGPYFIRADNGNAPQKLIHES